MKKMILLTIFASTLVFSENDYCGQIDGTWVLTEKTPVSIDNSNPQGTINSKWFFDSINLKAHLHDIDSKNIVDYNCQENQIVFSKDNKPVFTLKIISIENDYLKTSITQQSMLFGDRTTYQTFTRNYFQCISQDFEPISIEVLIGNQNNKQIYMLDIKYDEENYNHLTLDKKIIGVWEVNKYDNMPRNELPPYGLLNDIYIISKNKICIISRYDTDTKSCLDYSLDKNNLIRKYDTNSIVDSISFNKWGHLVLSRFGVNLSLKLLSKDLEEEPVVPIKVVLVSIDKNT